MCSIIFGIFWLVAVLRAVGQVVGDVIVMLGISVGSHSPGTYYIGPGEVSDLSEHLFSPIWRNDIIFIVITLAHFV